jgi:hypothetical protein
VTEQERLRTAVEALCRETLAPILERLAALEARLGLSRQEEAQQRQYQEGGK